MNIGIYGKKFDLSITSYIQLVISNLDALHCKLIIYEPYYELLLEHIHFPEKIAFFKNHETLPDNLDFLFSIGGDGTLLDSILLLESSAIPIVGINTGRLGFLADISKENIPGAINSILKGDYSLDERTLIKLDMLDNPFGKQNYALNEVSIVKADTSSMLTIKVIVNDCLLNTYWADGLLIATPTGSTGYSLSCGGPIITPDSKNFIITPIASHNLTVRPIVIPDDKEIRLKVEGRNQNYMVGLDSRLEKFNKPHELTIKRADYKIVLAKMNSENFFNTLRNKLMWGHDKREII